MTLALGFTFPAFIASILEESRSGLADAFWEILEVAEDDPFWKFAAAVIEILFRHANWFHWFLLPNDLLLVIEYNDAVLFVKLLRSLLLIIENHNIFFGIAVHFYEWKGIIRNSITVLSYRAMERGIYGWVWIISDTSSWSQYDLFFLNAFSLLMTGKSQGASNELVKDFELFSSKRRIVTVVGG